MRLTTTLAATVLATAAIFAAGCGGDDNKSDNGNGAYGGKQTPETVSTESGSAGGAASGTAAISMKNIQFDPKDQVVKVGTKVTWTNDDSVDHNVTATDGADFKSDNFGQDGTYEFTPKSAGTIKYTCTLHPGMDGTLDVTN